MLLLILIMLDIGSSSWAFQPSLAFFRGSDVRPSCQRPVISGLHVKGLWCQAFNITTLKTWKKASDVQKLRKIYQYPVSAHAAMAKVHKWSKFWGGLISEKTERYEYSFGTAGKWSLLGCGLRWLQSEPWIEVYMNNSLWLKLLNRSELPVYVIWKCTSR